MSDLIKRLREAAKFGGHYAEAADRIVELEKLNSTLGQAVVLCDSTDPDNPVMDGKFYAKAMKALEADSHE